MMQSMKPTVSGGMLLVLALSYAGVPAFGRGEQDPAPWTVFADFEGSSFAPWTAEGNAFGENPKRPAPAAQRITGSRGQGLANSYAIGGDAANGRLTSPEFVIRQPVIAFLLGGGNHPLGEPETTNIQLVVDGRTVRSATGLDSDGLEWVNWDVDEFAGKTGRLVIEDTCTGGWGHIVVDQIVFSQGPMPAFALAAPFSDSMVLQREKPIAVWGTALAGQRVRVTFGGQTKEATAGDDRRWRIALDPLPASAEPRVLEAESLGVGGERLTITDVLIGEVWLASGQSNMGFQLRGCSNGPEVVKQTNLPTVRFLRVPGRAERTPLDTISPPAWRPATPQYAGDFSGVAFFFARHLQDRLHVPVGIIQSAYGGTPAEAWTSSAALATVPQFKQAMEDDLAKLAAIDADPTKAADPKRFSLPFAAAGGLSNAMIQPLVPSTIRGVIWYQGESNAFRAEQYARLLPLMIADWRARFGQGDFPFYLVQLANYYDPAPEPIPAHKRSTDDWVARLREAQLQVVNSVPNTGLAVAIDVGEKSIHPTNKQDIGDRLATLALARTYEMKDVTCESPMYASMNREGSAIRVTFSGCPRGLMVAAKTGLEPAKETSGVPLSQFAIAGADLRFAWADARIDGQDAVVVSSPAVPDPVAVRYAWALNPAGANLYGKNGLPASPFRTDAAPLPADGFRP
jgi:sialate O-acetylesterase